jgi:undecaprenyl-diphosphatase
MRVLALLPHILVLRVLVPLGLLTAAIWGFVALADEVIEGETHDVDTAIIQALRVPGDLADPLGPPWFEDAVRDVTSLGSAPVLVLAVVAVTGFLALSRAWKLALFTLAASLGGLGLSSALKYLIDRPRPELVPRDVLTFTSSFPSGHSMMSAVVYLTLAALVVRLMEQKRLKGYALAVALVLTLIVGLSRIYLGVHWPTDVLAGWTAGAAWALLCWAVAQALRIGKDVEE